MATPAEPAGVAHAELRRAQKQVGVLESRRVGTVEVQVLGHEAVRADLDFGLVVDVERREARLARPHEQRDVVAPGHERPLESAQLLAAARHELRELFRLAGLEFEPALHVHAAEQPGGVHAVVDVGCLDVGFVGGAGAREHVAVAGRIHHHLGAHRLAARLALEDRAAHLAVLHQRHRRPGVEYEAHLLFQHHFLRSELQPLRDRRSATR